VPSWYTSPVPDHAQPHRIAGISERRDQTAVRFALGAGKGQRSKKTGASRFEQRRPREPQTERDIMAQAIMDPSRCGASPRSSSDLTTISKIRLCPCRRALRPWATPAGRGARQVREEFKQTMKALKKFVEVSNQHTPYLLRKAQRIEEYLNQH